MKHFLTHLLRGGIMALLIAVAAVGGTAEARGAVVPRNPVAIMSEPTYSDSGTELTITLWMYNYTGQNANFVADVWLLVDGQKACLLSGMWNLLSNVTDENQIKNLYINGPVGRWGSIVVAGRDAGKAQFYDLRNYNQCKYNENPEATWNVVDLKLSFVPSFSYRAHTIAIQGNWRDWCEVTSPSYVAKTLENKIAGFPFPQDMAASMADDTEDAKVRLSWNIGGPQESSASGSWIVYKEQDGNKTKIGEAAPGDSHVDMAKGAFDCHAKYFVTFQPSQMAEGDTICGLTAASISGNHPKLANDVCQVCGHMLFRYKTTDGNIAKVNGDFGAGMVSHEVVDGECVMEFDKSITKIPEKAFASSKITGTLNIPKSVRTIGSMAFYGCSGLSGGLVIPSGVRTIGSSAFSGCSGLSGGLVIPDSVRTIEPFTFNRCSGLSGNLVIPSKVTKIGDCAFWGCSGLSGNLVIPDSVTVIGYSAFRDCSGLSGNLVIPDSVKAIEYSTFSGCSGLSGNLVIPSKVTKIDVCAFLGCSGLSGNLVIPNSVKEIGDDAFNRCSGLSGNLVIPSSVTKIGDGAFFGCSGLSRIEFRSLSDGVAQYRVYTGRKTLCLSDMSYVGSTSVNGARFAEASYERAMANEWGTLVLPFAVSLTGGEAYALYSVESVTADELVLRRLTGSVAAGTPCIVRRGKDDSGIKVEAANISTSVSLNSVSAGPLELTGTYATQDVTDGYIIANDRFWSVGELLDGTSVNGVRVAPFRAWLKGSTAQAAQLRMRVPGEATGIEAVEGGGAADWLNDPANEYYDLGGRRTGGLRTGVNIVRTKSGATRKVVIR